MDLGQCAAESVSIVLYYKKKRVVFLVPCVIWLCEIFPIYFIVSYIIISCYFVALETWLSVLFIVLLWYFEL